MTIPALPSLDRTSPTFKTDLDAFFLTDLPDTVTALNAELTRIDGILPSGYVATSTTSLAIAGSGTVTLTVQTNKGFAPGQFVSISVTADPATQMGGTVTAYDYTTGVLSVSVSQSAGSGTYAAWTVAMTTASASPYAVGDILLTNRTLTAPAWLPAAGGTYAQASYAALYAEVGLLTTPAVDTSALVTVTAARTWGGAAAQGAKAVIVSSDAGTSTVAAYSTNNGATWTASTLPAGGSWASVSFGATDHVMALSTGSTTAAYSTNGGSTWASRTLPANCSFIRYLNGLWLAFPLSGTTYYTSPSGDNGSWTTRSTPAAPSHQYYDVVVQNGVAVLCPGNYNSWVHVSTDGTTWTQRTTPAPATTWGSAAINSSGHIYLFSYSTNIAYLSTNSGVSWAQFTLPSSYAGLTTASADGEVFVLPINTTASYMRISGTTVSQHSMPSGLYASSAAISTTHVIAARAAAGSNDAIRIGRYSYDTATQFVMPTVTSPAPAGVAAYIKA